MSEVTEVSAAAFDREVLQSEVPVLVDFWGDHCPACRQIAPILDELARERSGSLKVVKVHAAENAEISARYGVRSMPTVFVFNQGMVRGQLMGARPRSAFVELIEQAG